MNSRQQVGDDVTSIVMVSAPFSGIEVHFRLLASEISASVQAEHLDAIWLEHHPTEFPCRLPPLRWNWQASAAWSSRQQLRAIARSEHPPDVLFFNHINPVLMANPLWRLPPTVLYLDATPMVMASMSEHYGVRGPRTGRLEGVKKRIYSRALRRARHVVCTSELVRSSLIENYSMQAAHISVIPFSIETSIWSKPRERPISDDTVRVLFVGADWRRKGGDMVLAAAERAEFSNCKFDFVTTGEVPNPPPNVFVHQGVGAGSEKLRQLFADASVFVLPTYADLSPIVLVEAMATGLPIISTDVGAIPELVRDHENGYIVPAGDQDAFLDRLRALVGSPTLRARMADAGRRRAETDHELRTNTGRLLELLANHPGPVAPWDGTNSVPEPAANVRSDQTTAHRGEAR